MHQVLHTPNKKEKVALSSVFASAAMTVMKLIVGLMTGSMGILSEAAHSLLDLGAAGMTLFAVKVSDKPADEEHPYGHGKIESVSALVETGLLFLTSAWIVYEAVHRLLAHNVEIEVTWYAFAVIIFSIIIDISRSRALYKVAKETKSQALEADALHFKSDIWSSAVVLVGLVFVMFGIKGADALAAIGVAIFVLVAGYRLGKRTIDVLIDTAPEGIADIVKEAAGGVEGVISVGKVRVRPLGPTVFIELEIRISRRFSVLKADEIAKKAREAIQKKVAGADVVIHAKPIQLKSETMIDVVRTVAAKHTVPVHDIVIDNSGDSKFISYDLELPGDLTISKAHAIADYLEKDIHAEIGADIELNTHIEPQIVEEISSDALSEQEVSSVQDTVKELMASVETIRDAHNILVRKIRGKIFMTLHCYADGEETLENAHRSASVLESLIREKFGNVFSVVVHVEPEESKIAIEH